MTRSRYERNGEMGQIYTDARTGKKYTESYDGKPPSVSSGGAVTAAAAATATEATGADAQCPASFHTIRGYGLMNATTTIGGHPRSATTSEQCVIIAKKKRPNAFSTVGANVHTCMCMRLWLCTGAAPCACRPPAAWHGQSIPMPGSAGSRPIRSRPTLRTGCGGRCVLCGGRFD